MNESADNEKTFKGLFLRIIKTKVFWVTFVLYIILSQTYFYISQKDSVAEIDLRQYNEVRKIHAEYPEIRSEIHNAMDDGYISNAEFEQIKAAVERVKISRVKSSLTKKEKKGIDSEEWEKMMKEIEETLKHK